MFDKSYLRSVARILTLGSLLVASSACEIDTRVAISESKIPPQFTLSGSGRAQSFFVVGPYDSLEDLLSYRRDVHVIWELSSREYGRYPVNNLPPITYGIVPSQFIQEKPPSRSPPALEEGKFYRVTAPSHSAGFRALCFKIDQDNAVKITCPER
jgi:hypothetical protein